MKHMYHKMLAVISVSVWICSVAVASHEGPYPSKQPHKGIDIIPKDAYTIIEKSQGRAFIVDVRTRFEYQDIGHAEGSYNIPLFFFSFDVGDNGYKS